MRIFMLCLLSTMLIASPRLPKRPVRPIRCRYVSLSGFPSLSTGRSKLMTTETCSTSIPDKKKASDYTTAVKPSYCRNSLLWPGPRAVWSPHPGYPAAELPTAVRELLRGCLHTERGVKSQSQTLEWIFSTISLWGTLK